MEREGDIFDGERFSYSSQDYLDTVLPGGGILLIIFTQSHDQDIEQSS